MELFIRIVDGMPFEHPIFEDNFRQAFPDIDIENLPPEFAKFERIAQPPLGSYQKNQRVQYEVGADGICRDVWYADEMTPEEIAAKQEAIKAAWTEHGYPSWIFDETLCEFVPPVPCPNDGKPYIWDETAQRWIDLSLQGTRPIGVARV